MLSEKCALLHSVREWLELRLAASLQERHFCGYFGVDAFVFRDARGHLKFKPLVELNPRVTMGHVALALEQRLAPGVSAEFRIMNRSEWNVAQQSFCDNAVAVVDGRLRRGCVRLGEVVEQTKLIPVLQIVDA